MRPQTEESVEPSGSGCVCVCMCMLQERLTGFPKCHKVKNCNDFEEVGKLFIVVAGNLLG